MPRRLALALTLLASATLGTPAWSQTPYGQGLFPRRTALARLGLESQWRALVPLSGTERVLSISLAENMVFAHTSHANFHAYDAESGRRLWTANLGTVTAIARPASVNSKFVFVTSANFLYALDRRLGRPIWQNKLGSLPTSATAADERVVMVGLSTGKLIAYHAESGKFAWNWQTTGALTSRPQPAVSMVAFGAKDGKLYVTQTSGQAEEGPAMLYRIPTGGEIGEGLGIHDIRLLLVPSADHNLYAVDLFTAGVKWVYTTGAPIHQEPLVAGNEVFVVNTKGVLASVDVTNGEPTWLTSTQGGRLIALSPSRVYLHSLDHDLFIADRRTGKLLADAGATFHRAGLDLRAFTLGWTNRQNDRLYFASPSGMLIALREVGQLVPRPLRDPKELPFGTIPAEGVELEPKPAPTPEPMPAPEGENPEPGAAGAKPDEAAAPQ